jgi:uncharacterized delta-60 repeat protein
VAIVLAIMGVICLVAPARAYGNGGLAPRFDFPDSNKAQARAIIATPDNGAVVAGFAIVGGRSRFALAQVDASGHLDPAFGAGGLVTTEVPGSYEPESFEAAQRTSIDALLRQPDGKLLAVGSAVEASSRRTVVAVARYLPNGVLDHTYGRAGLTTFSFQAGQDAIANVARFQRVRIGSATIARLVVGGASGDPYRAALACPALARLLDDGRLDRSFGRAGRVVLPVDTEGGTTGLLARPQGDLVISASTQYGLDASGFLVGRLSVAGRADRSFGGAGAACLTLRGTLAAPGVSPVRNTSSLVEQPGGKIVLGGQLEDLSSTAGWVLARFKRRFTTPIGCFSVRRAIRRQAIVRAALARSGQLTVDVAEFRFDRRPRRLGSVNFGRRTRGLVSMRWNMRVGGTTLRRDRTYLFTPTLRDRFGRVIGRADTAAIESGA